jgi:hypothetical protein
VHKQVSNSNKHTASRGERTTTGGQITFAASQQQREIGMVRALFTDALLTGIKPRRNNPGLFYYPIYFPKH